MVKEEERLWTAWGEGLGSLRKRVVLWSEAGRTVREEGRTGTDWSEGLGRRERIGMNELGEKLHKA